MESEYGHIIIIYVADTDTGRSKTHTAHLGVSVPMGDDDLAVAVLEAGSVGLVRTSIVRPTATAVSTAPTGASTS